MFNTKHPLILALEKSQREVERIQRGPIPVESEPKKAWNAALFEAKLQFAVAESAVSNFHK